MAKGSRKGLPGKKKVVSRLSKSGKFSTYSQLYHMNPFKKTSSSKGRKQQEKSKSSVADSIVSKMKDLPAINKRSSIEGTIKNINANEPMGSYQTNLLVSKLKSPADVNMLSEAYLSQTLPKMNTIDTNSSKKMVNEHTKIFNNIPNNRESYKSIINELLKNKSTMSEHAFSSLLFSMEDHQLVENILKNPNKKEAYEIDNLLEDQHIMYTNPLNQIMNYYDIDSGDNIKSTIINIQQKSNDLNYTNNGIKLTDTEISKNHKQININNDYANTITSSGGLHNLIFIAVDAKVAADIYKTGKDVTFNIYNSIVYEFKNGIEKLDDNEWRKLKEIKAINGTNFILNECAFYLHKNSKQVYLVARVSIQNNNDYNFLSLSNNNTLNVLDEYNDYIIKSIDTSVVSEDNIKYKLYNMIGKYKNVNNKNSYLLIEG